jgi:hypothetical protein
MPGYRLYFLDAHGGHIKNFREFDADGDGDAIEACERWREIGPMELWCRTRKVEHWPEITASARASLKASA